MKKAVLIIINILLIAPFIIWFRRGSNVAFYMLPVWLIMTVLNTAFSKSVKEIVLYNGILAIFAIIGSFVNGQLYFKYVCWDSIGEYINLLEMIIEALYITLITGIECFVKHLIIKHKEKTAGV